MSLDPVIARLLAEARAAGEPQLCDLTPAAARSLADVWKANQPQGPAVARVEETFWPGAAGPMRVRLYHPGGSGPLPLLVYIHGGGFVICDLDTHDGICRALCAGAGIIVASVDYRLAPEHPFPAGSDDALAAVRHARLAASGIGADPDRILVGGDSAGGNLATVACLRLRDEGGPALRGQLLFYPVTDHPLAGHDSYVRFAEGYGLSAADMVWYFDHACPDRTRWTDPRLSPLREPSLSGLPPAFVLAAGYDVLRDEALAYAARLADAGVETELSDHPAIHHGVLAQVGVVPSLEAVYGAACDWLKRRAW